MNIDKKAIAAALIEDKVTRDITSRLWISPRQSAKAVVIAKEEGIACGFDTVREVFRQADKSLKFKLYCQDGQPLKPGQKVALIQGKARSILSAERTALNFLSFASGTATLTHKFVAKLKGLKVKLLDTRKTIPGLRQLQKYAVLCGGGHNHRGSLAQAILVKDNHLKIAGLKGSFRKKTVKTEIEIDKLSQFMTVAAYKPDVIMLDNFPLKDLKETVRIRNRQFPRIKLEASGGINLKNIREVAKTGVDFISAGVLTHSAKAIDFSLEII